MTGTIALNTNGHATSFNPVEPGRILSSKENSQTNVEFLKKVADQVAILLSTGGGIPLRPPEVKVDSKDMVTILATVKEGPQAKAAAQQLAQFEKAVYDFFNTYANEKIKTSVDLIAILSTIKTAERSHQSQMAILNGEAIQMSAAATKNAGNTAFSGSVVQGVASVGITSASTYMSNKAISTDRLTNKTLDRQIIADKDSLKNTQFNLTKGNDMSLGSARPSATSTIEGQGNRSAQVAEHSPQVTPRQQAILDQAATHEPENALAMKQNQSKDEYLSTEQARNQSNLVGAAAFPVGNIVNGTSQMVQSGYNAEQQISQAVAQASQTREGADSNNARDTQSIIDAVQDRLEKDAQRLNDTLGFCARG